jgi:AcrR family transcriptional regulator
MSPRSDAVNDRLREESRRAIVEHALRLFGANGYDRTSMKAIAEAAGMSPGLIYHYFESKERLLHALFEESMADVRASFAEADAAPTPNDRIAALVRASFRILRGNLAFWRLSYGARMQGAVLDALGDRMPAWTTQIVDTLARYFREAGAPRPEVEAAILFALIDGVSQHFALAPDAYPLDTVADAIVAAYGRRPDNALFSAGS